MKKIFLICTIFLLSLMPVAYAQQTTPITEDEAIEQAKQALINQGSPGNWSNTDISAVFVKGRWWVEFSPKPNSEGLIPIGFSTSVIISSDGQNKQIIPGF